MVINYSDKLNVKLAWYRTIIVKFDYQLSETFESLWKETSEKDFEDIFQFGCLWKGDPPSM